MNAFYLGLLWLIYYALHSYMASSKVKNGLRRILGGYFRYYRAFYSFFALANFILLFALHAMLPSPNLFGQAVWIRVVALVLSVGGFAVVAVTIRRYAPVFWVVESAEPVEMITTGVYAWVRHPMYFGTLLLIIAWFLFFPSLKNLTFLLVSTGYLVVGTFLEEKKLLAMYGDQYSRYRARVKMLIPFLF